MNIDSTVKTPPVMALKGSMLTLTALQLLENDLDVLSFQLDEKIKQAPNFFHFAPIILDFNVLPTNAEPVNVEALMALLKSKKLIPIGIRGAHSALKERALEAGLAIFPDDKHIPKKTTQQDPQVTSTTKVITHPIRSGQQIYVPNGDLIVLSSVGHGAEVLADGHIHIYGALRGRALAGVMGNQDAMIMCKSLEAELVSIAGRYRLSDDLKTVGWKQSVSVQLKEDRLNILPI